jgi:hypothetical protein
MSDTPHLSERDRLIAALRELDDALAYEPTLSLRLLGARVNAQRLLAEIDRAVETPNSGEKP